MELSKIKHDAKRTVATHNKYVDFIESGKPAKFTLIKEWKRWNLVENAFPYDAIARQHHLLFPKRQFTHERSMSLAELFEFNNIKKEISGSYDSILENFESARSIPLHFHYHLINWKDL